MSDKITDYLTEAEILAQLAEEAAELSQAALKLRRALDGTNPTPKSIEECLESFWEEYADVYLCVSTFSEKLNMIFSGYYDNLSDKILLIQIAKKDRWLKRLQERGAENE